MVILDSIEHKTKINDTTHWDDNQFIYKTLILSDIFVGLCYKQ